MGPRDCEKWLSAVKFFSKTETGFEGETRYDCVIAQWEFPNSQWTALDATASC